MENPNGLGAADPQAGHRSADRPGALAADPAAHPTADPAADLTADLAVVSGLVSYLRATVGPVAADGPEAHACGSLCADPDQLHALVASTAEGRGTTDETVLASLFAQAYAFRIAGVAVASWALNRRVPDVAAEATAITIARARPAGIVFTDPGVRAAADDATGDPGLDWFFERLVEHHLRPFFASLRARTHVGERLLWGNAATSIATAFRALDGALAADPEDADADLDRRASLQRDAERFFAAAPDELRGLGGFIRINANDRDGWFWERTNCCLWYRTAERYCDDCSLLPTDERRAGFLATLTPPPTDSEPSQA